MFIVQYFKRNSYTFWLAGQYCICIWSGLWSVSTWSRWKKILPGPI